jgi:hypothetical protein
MSAQPKQAPVVIRLQAEAADQAVPVATLLRTAKIVATKLGLDDALVWIDAELTGYMQAKGEDLPSYRRLRGNLMGWNPYHGWQPVLFPEGTDIHPVFYEAPIGTSIGEIEAGNVRRRQESQGAFNLDAARKATILSALTGPKTDVALFLPPASMEGILEAVRNLVLDWALKLEKAGVLGDGMMFSETDKKKAAPVTQQFIIQNAGVVGNVTDNATVSNVQSASVHISAAAVSDLVAQIRPVLPTLPEETAQNLSPILKDLETEAAGKADQSKLRQLLGAARNIAEGAAGNLVAIGIVAAIAAILGA